jgi:hypothetical protein
MKTARSDLAEKPYTGILVESMPKWTVLTRPSDNEISELLDEKWEALFAHYGLDASAAFDPGRPEMGSAWANLAWHLARQHVPGFKGAPRKRGRPPARKRDDVTLFMHVEFLRRRDGLSDRKAIQKIAAGNVVSGTETTLLQRYKRAKPLFKPMSSILDNIAVAIGQDGLVDSLEAALFEDEKKQFCPRAEDVIDGRSPRGMR